MSGRLRLLLIAAAAVVLVGATYVIVDRAVKNPEPDQGTYCEEITALTELDAALGNLDAAAVSDALPHLEALELASPAEIRSQVTTLRTTVESLATAMVAAPSGDTAALEEVWRRRQADVEAIALASEQVVAYTARTCGVQLGGPGGSTPGSAPGGSAPVTFGDGGP